MAGELSDLITEAVWRKVELVMPDSAAPTGEGFLIIGAMSLKRHWPDASAIRCVKDFSGHLRDCGLRFGDPDYDWRAGAARALAADYAAEHGEPP